LSLSYNQLTGSIPSELGLLNQTLVELILLDNKLAGSIPSELGLLTHLNDLYLAGNHLTGSIQPELGLLTQIKSLHLHINELTGTMPPSLCSPSAFILVDCGEIACTCCFEAWFNTTSCA
jgi:Leucine-rich repeat (LRR) protein